MDIDDNHWTPLLLVIVELTIDQVKKQFEILNAISQPRGKHEVLVNSVYNIHKSSGSAFVLEFECFESLFKYTVFLRGLDGHGQF